jgi:hypothetical protein
MIITTQSSIDLSYHDVARYILRTIQRLDSRKNSLSNPHNLTSYQNITDTKGPNLPITFDVVCLQMFQSRKHSRSSKFNETLKPACLSVLSRV